MMKTLSDSTTVPAELALLLRLTRTEAQVARLRISQARSEHIRRELATTAREADARGDRIQTTIRRLGGAPDVFAGALGRVAAITKSTFDQAQPFCEGLLGDLALEHQLRDRAVFTRVLAQAQGEQAVVSLMDQLEEAHAETIEWITVRLGEVAQGSASALAPTPAQSAVSTVTRLALLPSRRSSALFNKAVNLLRRSRGSAEQAVQTTRKKLVQTTKATGEVAAAGRDGALSRAEEVAPSRNARKAVRQTRKNLGTIDAGDLPIKGYGELNGAQAIKAVKALRDPQDVRLVLRFEQAHLKRKGVSNAARQRISHLADQSVSA